MKHNLAPVFLLLLSAILSSASVVAKDGEKTVIALETDDFKLDETDISTLVVGEAQTIETDSGKIIDILRTSDGAEIYVDGELLELNFNEEALHGEHVVIHKEVEVTCDDGEEGEQCNHHVVLISDDEDIDLDRLHEEHESDEAHKLIVIKKTLVTED